MNTPGKPSVLVTALLFSSSICVALAAGRDDTKRTWDFESDEPGMIAKGFTNEVGEWLVSQGRRQQGSRAKGQKLGCVFQSRAGPGHEL